MSTKQHIIKKSEPEVEVERKDWWLAHNGNIEFITATEAEVEEMGADEWGAIRSFTDKRKKEEEVE